MKLIFILMLAAIFFVSIASADTYKDDDGVLGLKWLNPNTEGTNPLKGILISYEVNGVMDAFVSFVPASGTRDSTVILNNIGDWAIARLRAISIVGDTSAVLISDTALFALPTGIDPPTAPIWE